MSAFIYCNWDLSSLQKMSVLEQSSLLDEMVHLKNKLKTVNEFLPWLTRAARLIIRRICQYVPFVICYLLQG